MGFETSFANLLQWEGGYSNNVHDAGGPTSLGVIQSEYDAYRKRSGLPLQSVAHITINEAKAIYRIEYWNATGCNDLNPGVDNAVFDSDVNSGDKRGVEWLQEAINQAANKPMVVVDGKIGPKTIAAANGLSADKLIDALLTIRLAFMHVAKNSKTGELLWPTFGKGWSARIIGVRAQSHVLADIPPSPTPLSLLTQPMEAPMTATTPVSVPSLPVAASNSIDLGAILNGAISSAKTSLTSIGASIAGMFTSVSGGGLLITVAQKLDPGFMVWATSLVGVLVVIVGGLASLYSLVTHVSATNNSTAALGEKWLNGLQVTFGLPVKDFTADNNAGVTPTTATA